jgi:hypothetical protein
VTSLSLMSLPPQLLTLEGHLWFWLSHNSSLLLQVNQLFDYPTLLGFETGCHYVAQAGHRLAILLPQPPESCDYRCVHHTWLQLIAFVSGGVTDIN